MSDNNSGDGSRSMMQYMSRSKSAGIAYLIWFFLGGLGVHRFYLGETGTGIAMLVLFVFGWLTTFIVIGFVPLAIVGLWWLVDAFLIPGMVERHNTLLADELS